MTTVKPATAVSPDNLITCRSPMRSRSRSPTSRTRVVAVENTVKVIAADEASPPRSSFVCIPDQSSAAPVLM